MKNFIIILLLGVFFIYATQTVNAQANFRHTAVKHKNGKTPNHRKAISFSQPTNNKNPNGGNVGCMGRGNKSTRGSIKGSTGSTACISSSKKPEEKNSTGPVGPMGRNKSSSNGSVK